MKESVEKRLLDRMRKFTADLKSGVDIEKKYTVTRVTLSVPVTAYNGELARSVRSLLGVSQPIFAEFLGVSPQTIKAWEQDVSPPSGMAAHVLDWIRDDPEYWRGQLKKVTVPKSGKKTRRVKAPRQAKTA